MRLKVPESVIPVVRGKDNIIKIGNTFKHHASFSIQIEGSKNILQIGSGVDLHQSKIEIKGSNCRVRIGKGCRLKGCIIVAKGEGAKVQIGQSTSWESGAILAEMGGSVVLGEDCMLSNEVIIRTSDGHGIFDRADGRLLNEAKPIWIGRHVWIGNHARINKGTRIGSGTVLGQMSVASGVLKPSTIYAGVPARPVRSNIVWARTYNFQDAPEDLAVSDLQPNHKSWKSFASRLLSKR